MITRERFYAFLNAVKAVRNAVSDDIAATVPALYQEWSPDGVEYGGNVRVLYEGDLYKYVGAAPTISQPSWNPKDAVSLWAKVLIPDDDQIYEWEQPDSTNLYKKGDKVRHNGKVWESDYDNNSWEPGVFGWHEIEED